MTFEYALEYVNSFLHFGIKPGLERIKILLDLLDNPQKKLKFIHVAGTNGKGSTCMFLSSILKASGLKAGMFISPFVLDFRERFQINGKMISKRDFVDILDYMMPFIKKMPKNGKELTEFELITVIAFLWFKKSNCDVVILEVGLGGRLDATNIIENALISVITSISYDHMNILGDTIEKIASEKAGILKQNGTLVLYPKQKKEVNYIIKKIAKELNNNVVVPNLNRLSDIKFNLCKTEFKYMDKIFFIKLLGMHQIYNAVMAISVANELIKLGFKISEKDIKRGLINTKFACRLEIISKRPLVILDGAHNHEGAKVLAQALNLYLKNRRIIAIVGMLRDKDVYKVLETVAPLVSEFIAVQPDNPRAMSSFEINKIIKNFGKESKIAKNLSCAVEEALTKADDDSVILIFGSLYLASQIRPILLSYCEDI